MAVTEASAADEYLRTGSISPGTRAAFENSGLSVEGGHNNPDGTPGVVTAPIAKPMKPTLSDPYKPAGPTSSAPTPKGAANIPGTNLDVSRLRYNARRAEVNVTSQAAADALTKARTREQMIQRQRIDLLNDLHSGNITQEEFNARGSLITSGALQTAALKLGAQGRTEDANTILAGIGGQTYDPVTHTIVSTPIKPGSSSSGGAIAQLRDIRQSGGEGGIDGNGDVQITGPGVYEGTGQASPAATPIQIAQNAKNLVGIMDGLTPAERQNAKTLSATISDLSTPLGDGYDTNGNLMDPKLADPTIRAQMQAERDAQLKAAQKQMADLQAKNDQKQKDAGVSDVTTGVDPNTGLPVDKSTTTDTSTTTTTPDPNNPSATDLYGGAVTDAAAARDEAIAAANAPGSINWDDAVAEDKKALAAKLDLADDTKAMDDANAAERERQALAVNDRSQQLAQIEDNKAQLDQIKLNADNEVINRRRINKLSGGHDYGGLNYVQKQAQAGLDTLNYLRDKAANLDGQFGDKAISVINQYGLDLQQAELTKKKSYSDDYDTYLSGLADIRKELRLDQADKNKRIADAHAAYSKVLTDADFKYGDMLKDVHLKAIDRITGLEKLQIQTQNAQVGNAIKMMALATKKGVKLSPGAIANFEKTVAPDLKPGWFSMQAPSTGGGAGSNFKTWQPEGLTAAMEWVKAQPGRSMTQLSPSDQQWLVPFATGQVPGSPDAKNGQMTAHGIIGGPPEKTSPQQNAFSFEASKPDTATAMVKEYQALVKSGDIDPKTFTMLDYANTKSFGTLYGSNPALKTASQNAAAAAGTDSADTTVDDIINSDSFDFSD